MKTPAAKRVVSRNKSEKVKKVPHGQAKGPNAKPQKPQHPMKQKPHS